MWCKIFAHVTKETLDLMFTQNAVVCKLLTTQLYVIIFKNILIKEVLMPDGDKSAPDVKLRIIVTGFSWAKFKGKTFQDKYWGDLQYV